VYHTNDKVTKYNATVIIRLITSVIQVTLTNISMTVKIALTDTVGNLTYILSLYVRCRVMLISNLWIKAELFNDTLEIV